MEDKHKGAWAETVAKAYLLSMGFEVYENVSQHGPIDFIAICPTTHKVSKFDVKKASLRRGELIDGYLTTALRFQFRRTPEQKDRGVHLLHVTPGGIVLTDTEARAQTAS